MQMLWVCVGLAVLTGAALWALGAEKSPATQPATTQATSIYEFAIKDIDGKEVRLADFKGKAVLIVNVASKCGYTKQYADLEKLYEQYKDKGLVILGFPANNFMGQEPGTDEEIKQFCTSKYNVTFPMFSKISVKGEDKHPLYQYLTAAASPAGEVGWNFEKFLISPDGQIIGRYKSGVKPMSEELVGAIQAAIAKL